MRRALSAMPTAAQMPCPSEPVATSTKGRRGVGCPSRSLSMHRSFSRSSGGTKPASAHAAYSNGAACPFDRTKRSLSWFCGSRGSRSACARRTGRQRCRRPSNNSTDGRCPPHSWRARTLCADGWLPAPARGRWWNRTARGSSGAGSLARRLRASGKTHAASAKLPPGRAGSILAEEEAVDVGESVGVSARRCDPCHLVGVSILCHSVGVGGGGPR